MKATIMIGALVASAQATPLLRALESRDSTSNCIVSAIWGHSDTLVPLPNESDENNEGDTYKVVVTRDGKEIWNDNGKTHLLGTVKNTTFTTGLNMPLTFSGSNYNGWQYCDCQFGSNALNHSTDINKDGSSTFLTTADSVDTCNCGFSCPYAPGPAEPPTVTLSSVSGSLAPASVKTPVPSATGASTSARATSSSVDGAGIGGAVASIVGNGESSSAAAKTSTAAKSTSTKAAASSSK